MAAFILQFHTEFHSEIKIKGDRPIGVQLIKVIIF